MTEAINRFIEFIKYLLTWWFFVEPWEQAVRVRAGSALDLYGPGVHFRIPFLDSVYVHNTRRMICAPAAQTLSSQDGQIYVVGITVSYCIIDVLKLHTLVHDPEGVLTQTMSQAAAEFINSRDREKISPDGLREFVAARIAAASTTGLGDIDVCVSNFAAVRTYRLIQDNLAFWRDGEYLLSTSRKR
jgi:regulator of protease activity HflC (stomatin/prohibitin superfamily)